MKIFKKPITLVLLGIAFCISCGIQLQSMAPSDDSAKVSDAAIPPSVDGVVYRFFDEDFVSGGFEYAYPDESRVWIPEESGKHGEVSLQFDLIADEYSGGSVCLWNLMYDLTPLYNTGALQFWIKGARGGEVAWAALVDDEANNGLKTVVRLPINNYGNITADWTQITIPLRDFGKRGVYWDAKKRVEVPEPFQWDKVCEFRIEIKKGENPSFTVWVDDIFIVRDAVEPVELVEVEYWDDREETLSPPPVSDKPDVKALKEITKGDLPAGGFAYVYGGKTAYKVQSTEKGDPVFTCYMDGSDYSGVTMAFGSGNNVNLTKQREGGTAGLAFWAKGGPATTAVYVGLLDDESDGRKVQTKVALTDFGVLDETWRYYMVPIRRFLDQGRYWDEIKASEVIADMDWSKINEIRFSVNMGENRIPGEDPVVFYVHDIAFIEEIPGYVDPVEYWDTFSSDAPDHMLHDFESELDQKWETSKGPKSEVSFKFIESTAENGGDKALEITYRLNDWCDVIYNYRDNNRPAEDRDWTNHWGLKFDMYTKRAYQPINVQIQDSGNEIWIAATGGERGWTEIVVPFRDFYKFPYYQPPDAVQDGVFNLKSVIALDFKPSGEGTSNTFAIDNVRLTNDKEARRAPVAESVDIVIKGDFGEVITEDINEGVFGINAALWDGDLLLPETEKYVKAVNHHVLRYPGGLRADVDNWKEVLAKKDWMVDTDEFLEFCRATNTEAMITVNYGTGSVQDAADWVEHHNVKNKDNVRFWEIGNELYGDWHPQQTSAEEYGKRTRRFIEAMKAVDPDILVTFVGVLEGEWNRIVLEHVKDIADGINVHHYPQNTGEENDAGLLSSPQTLLEIIPNVRRQLEEWGEPGKHYEIWLTEWNSVDFKPGPQTLSIVNGLFLADYLGVLTHLNIEQASYWDIHNDVTDEGGDYGYLSRTGAPDGCNVPRPSYWAFLLASHSLGRGQLLQSSSENDYVTTYLTKDGDRKSLMLINKYPKTRADITIDIPGFGGKATMKQLRPDNAQAGPEEKSVDVTKGMKMSLPAYSLTTITLD